MDSNELSQLEIAKNAFTCSLTLAKIALAIFIVFVTSRDAHLFIFQRRLIGWSGLLLLGGAFWSFAEFTTELGLTPRQVLIGTSYSLVLGGMVLLGFCYIFLLFPGLLP